jgi:hypothetical protein
MVVRLFIVAVSYRRLPKYHSLVLLQCRASIPLVSFPFGLLAHIRWLDGWPVVPIINGQHKANKQTKTKESNSYFCR